MYENCNRCGLHYQIEPSFFYGAMYGSYGLTVMIGVAAFIISNFYWFRIDTIFYCHYYCTYSSYANNSKNSPEYLHQYVCEF